MAQTDVFVGREEELKELSALLNKKSASLIVVRGRRRVGKSRLIEEFAKGKRFLPFAGIPITEKTTAQSQRDVFAGQLGENLNLQGVTATDWSTLFSLLAQSVRQGQVVILLDEISWMGSKDPDFLGKLKHAWDTAFKKNPQLILVLCGSVSTWIEENILSSTGFFGRISIPMLLEELPLHTCHQLLLSKGFRRSVLEEFKILSVTGGIPWYLENVQPNLNADDNIRNFCFQKNGLLFNEFQQIFHDLFEKRAEIYQPIVKVLAKGPMKVTELAKALRYPKSGTLSEYLDDLVESGFVTRDYTWKMVTGKSSRTSLYRLSDNYLRFYLKYVEPNREAIEQGKFKQQDIASLPGWNTMMGLQFENLVLKNRSKIWEKLGIRPEHITADNPYLQKASSGKKGCQIDYLIQTRYNTLFACEVKFSADPIGTSVIQEVKGKLSRLSLPKRFSCWPILIHVNGVDPKVEESGYFSEIIDFSQFLKT